MTRSRVLVCACILSALAVAYVPQGATGATKGTTLFTCKEVSPNSGKFKAAHCKPGDAGTGNFEHVAVAEKTTTELSVTNDNTGTAQVVKLQFTYSGIPTELQATAVSGSGSLKNEKEVTGEHVAFGSTTLTLTGVTVTKPSGKGCKVYTDDPATGKPGTQGVIDTESLFVTTFGQGDFMKFEPLFGGNVLALFHITECTGSAAVESLNGTHRLNGSFKGAVSGATVNISHSEVTTDNTLNVDGVAKAGLDASLTFKGRANSSETYTGLSATTVETP